MILEKKIGKKLALVLFIISLVFFGGNSLVFYFQSLQKTDGARIDASGRNRMLSQRIAYYSELVVRENENENDKIILSSLIELHNQSFLALKNGGSVPGIADGRVLPPTEPNIKPIVLRSEELWVEYKKNAELIVNSNTYINNQLNPKVKDALNFLENNSSEMLNRNNEIVKAYVRENDEKQLLLNNILYSISLIGIIFLFIITYIIRNLIKSISEITDVAQDLSDGNFHSRSKTKSKDELGFLALVINQMAENILEDRLTLKNKVKTRTKKLNDEKNKIDAILRNIGDGVFVVNNNLEVFMLNKATTSISGFTDNEILNKTYNRIFKFIHEEDKKGCGDFIKEAIKNGQTQTLPSHCELIKKDGTAIAVSAIASPLKNENEIINGCIIIFRDITKEREVDKSKTEFVSLASHQLRTPLTTIKWYTELLLSNDAGKINNEQKKYLDAVYYGSKKMSSLIDTLLNVSRLEMGTFIIESKPMNIETISKEVITELTGLLKKKNITIIEKYDDLPKINLDKKLMNIVILNLLSNATKYSSNGSQVNISISHDDHNMIIEVSDKGIGIPKEQQGKIFKKFHRADNAKKVDATGTGLGLYIAKSILDHSGGEISYNSEENKGTTFYVKIPLTGMIQKTGTKRLTVN